MVVSISYLLITMDKKEVYLTYSAFDLRVSNLVHEITNELKKKNIRVIVTNSFRIKRIFNKRQTADIAIAFLRNKKMGFGVLLNENCSLINKLFNYNLSKNLNINFPEIHWELFDFINIKNKYWKLFFSKVNSRINIIFSLGNKNEIEIFELYSDDFVKIFVDEILRCIRSDFNLIKYERQTKIAENKIKKIRNDGVVI